ncbi:MAG: TIGR01906 family membrane protein, partial [Chloroflexi bacterium]|nr:TIGR01906 family membrane protein [Chloroflexota bacterium]
WLTTLLVPITLILLGVRLMLTPAFPEIEYRTPGFPSDSYGFTRDERLHWAKIAIQYLVNDADISFLGELRFDDGEPLYTARELSHMLDVKILVQAVLKVWYAAVGLLVLLGAWAWSGKRQQAYRRGLMRGGWLTIGLTAIVAVIAAVSFWNFFAAFHALFFEGDTWLFLYSDTLIRLFPMRFWQDAFLLEGVIVLGGGLALGLGLKPRVK